MKKIVSNVFRTVFYFVFCGIMAVVESIKYIFKRSSILGKIFLLVSYSGMISLAFLKPTVFVVMLCVLAVCDLAMSIYMVKNIDSTSTNNDGNEKEEYKSHYSQRIPFFDGLSAEEAKREYRKLMKQYHPDNANGDAEMSKQISAAYSQFCAAYGR